MPTGIPQTIAAWDTQKVQLADAALGTQATTTVGAGRGDATGIVFIMTDIALRIAGIGIATDTQVAARFLVAGHMTLAGQSSSLCATAIAVFMAKITSDVATAGRLTDLYPTGAVGYTKATAAVIAAVTDRAFHTLAAK